MAASPGAVRAAGAAAAVGYSRLVLVPDRTAPPDLALRAGPETVRRGVVTRVPLCYEVGRVLTERGKATGHIPGALRAAAPGDAGVDLGLPHVPLVAPPEHGLVGTGTDPCQVQVGVQLRIPLCGDGRMLSDQETGTTCHERAP